MANQKSLKNVSQFYVLNLDVDVDVVHLLPNLDDSAVDGRVFFSERSRVVLRNNMTRRSAVQKH